jgi:hypothetical protein
MSLFDFLEGHKSFIRSYHCRDAATGLWVKLPGSVFIGYS